MSVDSLVVVLENLIFVDFDQIKGDIISIGLDGIGEVLNDEGCFGNLQELNGESELPGQNENLDDLFRNNIVAHILKEAEGLLMSKDYVRVHRILFFSLILNHNREEIEKFDDGLLVLVHLSMLYGDKLVPNVSGDVQHAIG